MKRIGWVRSTMVGLSTLGMVLPQPLLAAPTLPASTAASVTDSAPQIPAVVDVALASGGVLKGQVVNAEGAALSGAAVTLWQNQQQSGATVTDANGEFAIHGLRGGVYQVAAVDGSGVYRLWSQNAAPPSARPSALIVSGQDVLRGQSRSGMFRFLTNPWVLAGLIGTAIALPIALSNHKSSSS